MAAPRIIIISDLIWAALLPKKPVEGYHFRRFPPGSVESDVAAWLHARLCGTCPKRDKVNLDAWATADYEATGWESEAVALINFIKERLSDQEHP